MKKARRGSPGLGHAVYPPRLSGHQAAGEWGVEVVVVARVKGGC